MEGDSGKKTESESGKGTEMEGGLGKETESESGKETKKRGLEKLGILKRKLLDTQQQVLTGERHMLRMMGKSREEIIRYPDSDSGDEMDRYSGSLISTEPQLGISKGTARDVGGMEIGHDDSVVALSSHLEMLRREISFLMREVTSRGLLPAGKKKVSQEQISNLSAQFKEMCTQQVKEVNLPYLGCETGEEVMDFLLVETQQLLFRFTSLASTLKTFRVPISPDMVERLRHISTALVDISELIKSHKCAAQKDVEDCLDRDGWEATWGSRTGRNGGFDDITTLSSMHFTASTPENFRFPSVAGPALLVYSIKLVDLNPNLSWPLDVYGVVAAQDDLDHNRNILFCRSGENCQRIKQEDPFLHLTGLSRAIVADEPVFFQIELKLKYGAQFKDIALFTAYQRYRPVKQYDTMHINSCCCTAEISLERLSPSIQATIVGVRVVKGEPFNYGCKVSRSFSPLDVMEGCTEEVVLLDCSGERMHAGLDGS
ncbi:uncharacterized protein LOC125538556 [Triticum urartu]|uniref:uncharacterized protein LOC125538556 n=1 Tax=Triticum urartu TaxID=4572 RepID=UPI00204382AE|nr:uncharacterized protein LOC125538556 [Triticum urartu]